MSKQAIQLSIRAADGFGSDADLQDQRTPEQRAARQRAWLASEDWARLRWAAPVNLSMMGLLLASAGAGTAMYPALMLALACALAAVALAPRPPGEPGQRVIMAAESVISAAAVIWGAVLIDAQGLLFVAVALTVSPCARAGIAAWLHLGLLAGATAALGITTQPWVVGATMILAAVTAFQILRVSRHGKQRASEQMELEELNVLCKRLVADADPPPTRAQDPP